MRIIVADGNDNFRAVLVELLRDDGHDVRGVELGGELVAETEKSPPHVIITHVRFPDLDALEALSMLRTRGHAMPAILTSGDARIVPVEQMRGLGAVTLLEKPFTMEQLRAALAKATTD